MDGRSDSVSAIVMDESVESELYDWIAVLARSVGHPGHGPFSFDRTVRYNDVSRHSAPTAESHRR